MPSKPFKISIDSILGGRTSLLNFSQEGQFRNSVAIDPDAEDSAGGNQSSGVLTPIASNALTGNTMDAEPLWMNTTPKTDDVFIYDQTGKLYTAVLASNTISDLNNGAALSSASGNGAAYYDNYNYFATNTNITRYGPLNGVKLFTNSYWTSTLSLSALGNGVTYPAPKVGTSRYPNHPLHRHVDNKIYIGDVMAGNGVHTGKGAIHFIKTSKASVEGDTNDGSTYNALDLPYGIWPTDIESFGTDLAIATYEGDTSSGNTVGKKGKVYFWDTVASSFYKVVELPDPLVSALEYINGELIAFSGNPKDIGCRISRYIGGDSFEEIIYLEDSQPPLAGATDDLMSRVIFGGFTIFTNNHGVLYALGSKISKITRGLFNIMRFTGTVGSGATVTSCIIPENKDFTNLKYLIGWRDGTVFGIDRNDGATYGVAHFQSEVFKIGKPFEVNRLRIPLMSAVAANHTITVSIGIDADSSFTNMAVINNTNYTDSERFIDIHGNFRGKQDFYIQLSWSGTSQLSVALPIEIEGNVIEN